MCLHARHDHEELRRWYCFLFVYRFFDPELGCNLSLGQVP
jgi:hypothetical protein